MVSAAAGAEVARGLEPGEDVVAGDALLPLRGVLLRRRRRRERGGLFGDRDGRGEGEGLQRLDGLHGDLHGAIRAGLEDELLLLALVAVALGDEDVLAG